MRTSLTEQSRAEEKDDEREKKKKQKFFWHSIVFVVSLLHTQHHWKCYNSYYDIIIGAHIKYPTHKSL